MQLRGAPVADKLLICILERLALFRSDLTDSLRQASHSSAGDAVNSVCKARPASSRISASAQIPMEGMVKERTKASEMKRRRNACSSGSLGLGLLSLICCKTS